MRRRVLLALLALLGFCLPCCGDKGESTDAQVLRGRAEDLWGDTIELSDYAAGLTVMHPFSPSDCGYCLTDGEFAHANYGVNTTERGGAFFGMSLFAPQLDVYGYLKHYRAEYPVIAWPPALFRYHNDGYPFVIAFKGGEPAYSDAMWPYEETFKKVRGMLWGEEIPLTPTSNHHVATRFVWENKSGLGLVVIPDGEPLPEKPVAEAYSTKHESDLTGEDLKKNFYVQGRENMLRLEFLKGTKLPFEMTDEKIVIGDYEFPRSETGFAACFPNPYDGERYMVLKLRGRNMISGLHENWTDYTIYMDRPDGTAEVLLSGLFDKDASGWRFSRKKAWVSAQTLSFCKGGKCPSPFEAEPPANKPPYSAPAPARRSSPHGELWTLGGSRCRFPHVCADGRGGCNVVWEENGDIVLANLSAGSGAGDASAGAGAEPRVLPVEQGRWDSFNPVVAVCGEDTWVLYLSDQDGFYRLYGAYGAGGGPFNEVVLSGEGAVDCLTPDVLAVGPDKIVAAWAEWKANQRYLMYRTVDGRMLGEAREASIKKSDIDYTNAWYPSLAVDEGGGVWGAWNQHYPLTLGVCVGNLVDEAVNVSEEFGGYPSMAVDRLGRRWVVWESYMRDIVRGKPHRILCACSEGGVTRFSLPEDLSSAAGCKYNQTPEAAVDGDGALWVAWSGRIDDDGAWGIYLRRLSGEGWSEPRRVSDGLESARAPAIAAAGDGGVWLAWHSGTGADMQIKVLHCAAD